MKYVNEKGLQEILRIIRKHRKDGENANEENAQAYASDVEFQLGEGNPPCFELARHETLSGHVEEFEIDESGIDFDCDDCDGTGIIEDWDAESDADREYRCPTCDGEGVV